MQFSSKDLLLILIRGIDWAFMIKDYVGGYILDLYDYNISDCAWEQYKFCLRFSRGLLEALRVTKSRTCVSFNIAASNAEFAMLLEWYREFLKKNTHRPPSKCGREALIHRHTPQNT